MDKIDVLIEKLNLAMDGAIEFDRDAVDVDRPEEWGAVELRRDQETQWADGKPIDTQYLANIYLSIEDRESDLIDLVNGALEETDELFPIIWGMADRMWLPDIERALWIWNVRIWGPLAWDEETETAADAGTDGTGTEADAGTDETGTAADAGTDEAGTEADAGTDGTGDGGGA